MMRRVPRVLAILGALSLALGACSDDGDGVGGEIDAPVGEPDASDDVDAGVDAVPAATRHGNIAVLDLTLTNVLVPAPPVPIRGAVVHIKYADLTADDVQPVIDTRVGDIDLGCAVWVYEVGTSMPQPGADEGAITIIGAESPVGDCTFDGVKYSCSTGSGTLLAGMTGVIPQPDGTADINLFYNEFQGQDLAGSRIALEGFADPANNGLFDVVSQAGDASITIANPNAVSEALGADANYMIHTGAGPTAAGRAFLGGDTDTITISKLAGPNVPNITMDIIPGGLGLTLDTESAQPHQMPVAPVAEASFSCSPGLGGACGVAVPPLYGLVISGFTTDGDISTSPMPNYMPAPVTSWARFECRSQANDPVALSAEALQAIVDTGATRIETSLWRVSENIALHPDTDFFAGHGLIGYTDVP